MPFRRDTSRKAIEIAGPENLRGPGLRRHKGLDIKNHDEFIPGVHPAKLARLQTPRHPMTQATPEQLGVKMTAEAGLAITNEVKNSSAAVRKCSA